MRNLRRMAVAVLALTCLSVPSRSFAKPVSGDAGECQKLGQFLLLPRQERKLADADRAKYLGLAKQGSADAQACAALFLEYTLDEASAKVLKELASSYYPLVRGAASFAMRLRGFSGSREELLGHLAFWMGRAMEPHERMFHANRLAVECGNGGLAAILSAAEVEESSAVRCDMLYYLVKSGDARFHARISSWTWDSQSRLGEALSFLMAALTPGRPQDDPSNSCDMLLRQLRSGK